MAKAINFKSIIGNKYNRLLVLKEGKSYKTISGHSKRTINCICDCGKCKDYEWQSVVKGRTKSCGCYSRDTASDRMITKNTKHGMYGTVEYNTWQSMKKRCLSKNHRSYKHYGGRGITVCSEWVNSFDNFLNDMGCRPSNLYSIERVDNNKGYSKDNCIWVLNDKQSQNQRTTINIEYNGETHCLSEWARKLNMSAAKLHYRLFKANYSLKKAFES